MNFLSKTGEIALRVVAVGISVVLILLIGALLLPVIAVSLLVMLVIAGLALIAVPAILLVGIISPSTVDRLRFKIDAWTERAEDERARNRADKENPL